MGTRTMLFTLLVLLLLLLLCHITLAMGAAAEHTITLAMLFTLLVLLLVLLPRSIQLLLIKLAWTASEWRNRLSEQKS